MTELPGRLVPARGDIAWAIATGGICVVVFAGLLAFSWYYAATLFMIFAGILLGLFLNAVTELLGRLIGGPHGLRLALVGVLLAALFGGVVTLGGATIAQQATALSTTIKSQIVNVKNFLDRRGIDTSFLEVGGGSLTVAPDKGAANNALSHLPSAGAIASGTGAIVNQTLHLLLGTVGAVGNFFIVLFLGLCFAAQPDVYRRGLLRMMPRRHRDIATRIVDTITETLRRWLIAQMITMAAVFVVTWIGLTIIGIQGAFILGIQAGLLAFIPTVGAIVGGLIIVLASLAAGWAAVVSAFVLFLGVHALESYILTPLIQREAIDIPPATLFATQILLGVVFGVWGLALALPLMASVKVIVDTLRADNTAPAVTPKRTDAPATS